MLKSTTRRHENRATGSGNRFSVAARFTRSQRVPESSSPLERWVFDNDRKRRNSAWSCSTRTSWRKWQQSTRSNPGA